MVEEKKKNGSVVVTIFLVLIIIGLIFYICYDKGLILKQENKKNSEETKEEVEKEEEKEEELDIHSVLVQELYNKVSDTTDEISWNRYHYFYDGSINNNYGLADFISKTGSEIIKMRLVGKNLRKSNDASVDCTKVPDEFVEGVTYESVCKKDEITLFSINGYKKEVVERTYQELFGSDQKVDTSIPIGTINDLSKFVYVPSLDIYVKYLSDNAGVTNAGGYKGTLSKAIKNGKEIKIYETVEEYESIDFTPNNLQKKDTFTFVYTFEQENTGNYKFVSRIKEKA